mgnify:CR=1 FL=1
MSEYSAGILLYRLKNQTLEVFLVHPGGPFWSKKDNGAWSIPKGLFEQGEEAQNAAIREFEEETGFKLTNDVMTDLGELKQPSGKIVHAWAVEQDVDEKSIVSNLFTMEWPKGTGVIKEFPEIDRGGWFNIEQAGQKLLKGQVPFLERLISSIDYHLDVSDQGDAPSQLSLL